MHVPLLSQCPKNPDSSTRMFGIILLAKVNKPELSIREGTAEPDSDEDFELDDEEENDDLDSEEEDEEDEDEEEDEVSDY